MGLKARRRALAGRTYCGVCGVEQLNDIGKPVQPLPFTQSFDLANLDQALAHLNDFQPIGYSHKLYSRGRVGPVDGRTGGRV